MEGKLLVNKVGPWPMNSYLVVCEHTQTSAIIDPGADPELIIASTAGTRVDKILITHGHRDHIGALEEVRRKTSARIFMHPADAAEFKVACDTTLQDGEIIMVGAVSIRIWHTPGHTPGQVCFDLGDGRIIVGDTVFVGGPGATRSPENFALTMETMQSIVFSWPDETRFYPGHGDSGTIGQERPAFEAFVARGWSKKLCGDVVWK